ncbi:hypothetical protein NQ314_001671, partial [Rhamnusium bicolor]
EKGVNLNINNKEEIVYFKLGLTVGDNLGLHSILVLTESFAANFRCRFCKMNKCDSMLAKEDENLLRNSDNYIDDINRNDITGIKELCIWHELTDFHLTTNYCVALCTMFLKVCNYDICLILQNLIFDLNLFSLTTLNSGINCFNYTKLEKIKLTSTNNYRRFKKQNSYVSK